MPRPPRRDEIAQALLLPPPARWRAGRQVLELAHADYAYSDIPGAWRLMSPTTIYIFIDRECRLLDGIIFGSRLKSRGRRLPVACDDISARGAASRLRLECDIGCVFAWSFSQFDDARH